ncbi:MAG: hypothetical protein CL484_02225 [Acidobacteria bacterium]|nr:hypothetical protein [Acidobacteriota bacterium]
MPIPLFGPVKLETKALALTHGPVRALSMIVDRKTTSIMKACELVGVSRRTIYNWIASGKVEYVRTAGGSVRIFVDTLWREPGSNGGQVESLRTEQ